MNRLHCKGTTFDVELVLGNSFYVLLLLEIHEKHLEDVNFELFEIKAGERTAVVLARYVDLNMSEGLNDISILVLWMELLTMGIIIRHME